jgi:hypothetical protein
VPFSLRFPLWAAVAGAAAALAAYLLTFGDRPVYQVLMLVPVLFLLWPLVLWRWRRVPRRNLVSEIFGDIPRWLKAATAALLLFGFANFFAGLWLNAGAHPHRLADGRLVLERHGHVVRTLDAPEFRHAELVQLRVLAAWLVPCYGLAAVLLQACWIKNGPAMADRKI